MEAQMKKLALALAVLVVTSSTAIADPDISDCEYYEYACTVNGEWHPLQMRLCLSNGNSIKWMGYEYKLSFLDNCPRFGWHAEGITTPIEISFDFCTATQGYAFFKKPIQDKTAGDFHVQCRQKIAG